MTFHCMNTPSFTISFVKYLSFRLRNNRDEHLMCQLAAAAKSLQSCPTLCDPIDDSPPGSPIPGILKARTHWSGLPFPSPGDHPDPGIEPKSAALQADAYPLSHRRSPNHICLVCVCI